MASSGTDPGYTPAPRFHQFEGLSRSEWQDDKSCNGYRQWMKFRASINDSNRRQPRRLALSHWNTLDDLAWIEENLPNLTELDISDIQDGLVLDGDLPEGSYGSVDARGMLTLFAHGFYEWSEALYGARNLWPRLEKLWVRHWGCAELHNSRFRHSEDSNAHELGDYQPEFRCRHEARDIRLPEAHSRGADVTAIISACTNLKVLAVRGPSLDRALSNIWRPRATCLEHEGGHGHVCALVKGLENAPRTLERLELHQSEFSTFMSDMLKQWTPVRTMTISFGDILRRFAPGREPDVVEANEKKWPKAFDDLYNRAACQYCDPEKNLTTEEWHESLDDEMSAAAQQHAYAGSGNTLDDYITDEKYRARRAVNIEKVSLDALVRYHTEGVRPGSRLNDFLISLWISARDSTISLGAHDTDTLSEVPISFFSFVLPSPYQATLGIFGQESEREAKVKESLEAFKYFHANWSWRPLWDFDPLMSPLFPFNVGIETIMDTSVLMAVGKGLRALKGAGIPVRLLIGYRPPYPLSSGSGLYWGDMPADQWNSIRSRMDPRLVARKATYDATIASLTDELLICYQPWAGRLRIPISPLRLPGHPRVIGALRREARAWRRWWHEFALHFTALRRLVIRMPSLFDQYDSRRLAKLLGGGEQEEKGEGSWLVKLLPDEEGPVTMFVCREWKRVGGKDEMTFGEVEWKESEEELVESDEEIDVEVEDQEAGDEDDDRVADGKRRLGVQFEDDPYDNPYNDQETGEAIIMEDDEDREVEPEPEPEPEPEHELEMTAVFQEAPPSPPPEADTYLVIEEEAEPTPSPAAPQAPPTPPPAPIPPPVLETPPPPPAGTSEKTNAKPPRGRNKKKRAAEADAEVAAEQELSSRPPKTAKKPKKSRWERELEALRS